MSWFSKKDPGKQWTTEEITRVMDVCQIEDNPNALLLSDPMVVVFILSMVNPTSKGVWDGVKPSGDALKINMAQLYSLYLYFHLLNEPDKADTLVPTLDTYKQIELVDNFYDVMSKCTEQKVGKSKGLFESYFGLGLGGIHRQRMFFDGSSLTPKKELSCHVLDISPTSQNLDVQMCGSVLDPDKQEWAHVYQLMHLPLTIVGCGGNWDRECTLLCSRTNEVATYAPVSGSTIDLWMLKRI